MHLQKMCRGVLIQSFSQASSSFRCRHDTGCLSQRFYPTMWRWMHNFQWNSCGGNRGAENPYRRGWSSTGWWECNSRWNWKQVTHETHWQSHARQQQHSTSPQPLIPHTVTKDRAGQGVVQTPQLQYLGGWAEEMAYYRVSSSSAWALRPQLEKEQQQNLTGKGTC